MKGNPRSSLNNGGVGGGYYWLVFLLFSCFCYWLVFCCFLVFVCFLLFYVVYFVGVFLFCLFLFPVFFCFCFVFVFVFVFFGGVAGGGLYLCFLLVSFYLFLFHGFFWIFWGVGFFFSFIVSFIVYYYFVVVVVFIVCIFWASYNIMLLICLTMQFHSASETLKHCFFLNPTVY